MKRKLFNYIMFLLLPITVFIACRKDNLSNLIGYRDEGLLVKVIGPFSLNSQTGACGNGENRDVSFEVRSDPGDYTQLKISRLVTFKCRDQNGNDSGSVHTDTIAIASSYYKGDPYNPQDTAVYTTPAPILGGAPAYCSNNVIFDVNNIIHYNISAFEYNYPKVIMLQALYDKAVAHQYNYNGTAGYPLDDLDGLFGDGSKQRLFFAVFGFLGARTFDTSFSTYINNVPASSNVALCDQSGFRIACGKGASHVYSPAADDLTDLDLLYDYFINEIAAHRM